MSIDITYKNLSLVDSGEDVITIDSAIKKLPVYISDKPIVTYCSFNRTTETLTVTKKLVKVEALSTGQMSLTYIDPPSE